MLRFLRIRHLAVIDAVEVEFGPGLNVLTGETGAGKSILVEAVSLLLGGRASGDMVRTGKELAVVEAIFENAGQEWLVKREVSSQGRSRAFINGELTTAGALRDLSDRFIELHGQHEHHTLLNPATHLAVLDMFGGISVDAVGLAFQQWRAAREQAATLQRSIADRDNQIDLLTFQLGELERAQLVPGEDEELRAQRQILASAERIQRLCHDAFAELYESDGAILGRLAGVWRKVEELVLLDPSFAPFLEARPGIKSQLEELSLFLGRYTDDLDVSPGRLQEIEDRLALLDRLKRKYGPTLADAIRRRDEMQLQLEGLRGGEARLAESLEAVRLAREAYMTQAGEASRRRRSVSPAFSSSLVSMLGELAMGDTRFEMRFASPLEEDEWSAAGIDQGEFFVSPNPGEDLRPLARIASGGELSRLMLAIKTLTAVNRGSFTTDSDRRPGDAAPGLIFDEIDAGIGGRVADVVGSTLRSLGSAFQVLCITHSPQIAAYADSHFHIQKSIAAGRTVTSVARLDEEERLEELSRMLGGSDVGGAIRESARQLLSTRSQGAKGENKSKGESESRRKRTK